MKYGQITMYSVTLCPSPIFLKVGREITPSSYLEELQILAASYHCLLIAVLTNKYLE